MYDCTAHTLTTTTGHPPRNRKCPNSKVIGGPNRPAGQWQVEGKRLPLTTSGKWTEARYRDLLSYCGLNGTCGGRKAVSLQGIKKKSPQDMMVCLKAK